MVCHVPIGFSLWHFFSNRWYYKTKIGVPQHLLSVVVIQNSLKICSVASDINIWKGDLMSTLNVHFTHFVWWKYEMRPLSWNLLNFNIACIQTLTARLGCALTEGLCCILSLCSSFNSAAASCNFLLCKFCFLFCNELNHWTGTLVWATYFSPKFVKFIVWSWL